MKYLFPLLAGCALAAFTSASADAYLGNGNTGFGGGLGDGMLSITASGGTLNFVLTTAGGNTLGGNSAAIYIDTVPNSGVNNTSAFMDTADNGRRALSGYNASNNSEDGASSRTLLTFPTNFGAEFGLSIEATYAGLFNLSNSNSFTYVDGMAPTVTSIAGGNAQYSFSLTFADLGLTPTSSFNFVGSLISTDAYRSNETIGASTTTPDPGNPGVAPNAGYNGSTTITSFDTFPAVPEPGSVACLGFGALALVGVARRRIGF